MTTCADQITWTAYEAKLKEYLGVETLAEDLRLKIWLAAAVDAADAYLAKDFVDTAGDDIELPDAVVVGLYEYVRALRSYYRRTPGLKSVKTNALGETYTDDTGPTLALRAAKDFWKPYKTNPLLDGK